MSTNTTKADESLIPKHPAYDALRPLWDQMRVTSAGEYTVKQAGEAYLPMTSGQAADPVSGKKHYEAYKMRAVFYGYLKDTQTDMIGLLTNEATVVTVPDRLEPYKLKASNEGEGISELQRRIYDEQLVVSRGGLLLDVGEDKGTETTPWSVLYCGERVINWDDQNVPPRWIVLDESHTTLNTGSLNRKEVTEYLLLGLDGNDQYYTYRFDTWQQGFDLNNPPEPSAPELSGDLYAVNYPELLGARLDAIPFTFFNATTISPDPELPALLPLSNLSLAVYRGEADYRQTLFMQGQETLFLKGFTDEETAGLCVGAGSFIRTNNNDADATFIGIGGDGLSEARESQESLKTECKNLGVELVENGAESGTALNTRLTIRTASIADIARVCAAALQDQLKYAAKWLGLGDSEIDEIVVTAPADFSESGATPREMLDLWAVVQQGGMTLEDYYQWLAENDFTEMTYEDWLDKVQATGGLALGDFTPGEGGGND